MFSHVIPLPFPPSLLPSVAPPSPRSGELTAEYEQKKATMLRAQEETAFSFQKKKVSIVHISVTLMEPLFHIVPNQFEEQYVICYL